MNKNEIREKIITYVSEYAKQPPHPFKPGIDPVPVSGKVHDACEMRYLVDAALDFWLTTGRFNSGFEKKMSDFLGIENVLTVNSGSSANLLAIASLTSPKLGERALKAGDEVITTAVNFPTTVNPILQYGMTPVFVDCDLGTYNVNIAALEAAITKKTRAIVLAHTLGNPFDLNAVTTLAKKHKLWLVEDCCDALGAKYSNKMVGTFGDIATLSFYPAHHITMGEGGAVLTKSTELFEIARSMRDWGRDCWCETGVDDTCKKRYSWKLGELPLGYDHKYTYSQMGYNLKITDMQAAVGLAQMEKIEDFIVKRNNNFEHLQRGLKELEDQFIFPKPGRNSEPSWFGFPITIKDDVKYSREDLLKFLNKKKIGTRLLFGGNLTRQPYMIGQNFRVSGELKNSDTVMNRTFWIGVYPGLTGEMIDYVIEQIMSFKA